MFSLTGNLNHETHTSSFWEELYAPLQRVPEIAYDGIMAPPSYPEVFSALTSAHPEKAPGPSGLQSRHFLDAGPDALKATYRVLCACFNFQTMPDSGLQSSTAMMPKSDAPLCGDLSKLRPITLFEVLQKVLWCSERCRHLLGTGSPKDYALARSREPLPRRRYRQFAVYHFGK
jgi:hypothetical protein